jgi:hypothetical protein
MKESLFLFMTFIPDLCKRLGDFEMEGEETRARMGGQRLREGKGS